MEKQVLNLTGSDLSFSDLVRMQRGLVKADAELIKGLKSENQVSVPVQVYNSRVFLGIVLNHYLKNAEAANLETVQRLENLINAYSQSAELPESLSLYLNQESYHLISELTPAIETLRSLVPILDGFLGFKMESGNFDSGLLNDDLFSITSQGLSTTLNNLQSLLNDSKLAKKNSPAETLIEGVQVSASLKDLLDESEKLIEKEANCVSGQLKKTVIRRSSTQVFRIVVELYAVSSSLFAVLGLKDPLNLPPLSNRPEDQLALIKNLQVLANDLLVRTQDALLQGYQSLNDFEAKINQGAAKPRPLQIGKGSRALYQYFKENQISTKDLSVFLVNLLSAKNEERRVPKIAKGMRDYAKEEMSIRQYVFSTIREVFQKHMADELDTPVMELRETLTGKYGEEGSKLIYNLADQGGELLSLRYDLTVPFARYVAMTRLTNWKRFQIGKVYRRDQPQMKRGRYREFYQCDFDIVGSGAVMSQESEVLKIVVEILSKLQFKFVVKINHRKLLDAILEISGIPSDKFRTVSSSIDKLDKEEWSKVRQELVDEKGITETSADQVGEYVKINGNPSAVLQRLLAIDPIVSHKTGKAVLDEIQKLIVYSQCLGIEEFLNLDMSLARGLDYYTGLVYEAVVVDGSVGSIAGGGRYDELISRLNNSNQPTPAVGVSLGVERLFTVIEERFKAEKTSEVKSESIDSLLKSREKCVLVAQAGGSDRFNLMVERYRICNLLWASGIKTETSYKEKSDPKGQAGYASQEGMRWIVWIGESELVEGKVKVKDLKSHSEELVLVEELIRYLESH